MAAPVLRFDDFELDRGAYELRRSGRVVRLERIPLELLFLLAERRGELVTREEILERVWGKGVFIDVDAGINAAVRKVRRALNDSADAPRFLVTIPAKGYRFVAEIQREEEEVKVAAAFEVPPVPEIGAVPQTAPAPEVSPVREIGPVSKVIPVLEAPRVVEEESVPRRRWKSWPWLAGVVLTAVAIVLIRHPPLRPTAHSAILTPSKLTVPAPDAAIGGSRAAPALPNMPSIAVLAFANLSGDPQQEYFSDGMSDQLITDLSRIPGLFVIARTSSFSYKNKPAKVQDIARELGVKYLLEGSVLKAGNRVRIATRLVDADTGADLWAERFDRSLTDIFAVQDDIVGKIVTTLNLQFELRQRRIPFYYQTTANLEAYDDFLRASAYVWAYSKEGNAKARLLYQKAIALDPNYADAYVSLGATYWIDWVFQWHPDEATLEQAFKFIKEALVLRDSHPMAHAFYGRLLVCRHQYGMAITESERAIALAPNMALTHFLAAETLSLAGKPAEAIELSRKAMRLDPINQDWYLMQLGTAYLNMGRYLDAIPPLQRFLIAYPGQVGARFLLVIAYAGSGMKPEARSEAAELMRQSPDFSLAQMKDHLSDRDVQVLRQAGLR